MLKKEIIAELKKFETYKKFSDKQLERKTKAALEEMLRMAKETQPKGIEVETSKIRIDNGKIVFPDDMIYIDDEYVELGVKHFAEKSGITRENVLKKFEKIEKCSGGTTLSNFDKMLCMGFDFRKYGINK